MTGISHVQREHTHVTEILNEEQLEEQVTTYLIFMRYIRLRKRLGIARNKLDYKVKLVRLNCNLR